MAMELVPFLQVSLAHQQSLENLCQISLQNSPLAHFTQSEKGYYYIGFHVFYQPIDIVSNFLSLCTPDRMQINC